MTNTGKGARPGGTGFHIERDLLCTANSDGYFTSLNSGWERVLGWTREELMSRPIIDFIDPADRTRAVAELAKVTTRAEVNLSAVSIADEEFTARLEQWIERARRQPVQPRVRDHRDRRPRTAGSGDRLR